MKIRKSFVINLSTYSFIVWISTIIYFIFSIKSHQNIDIWSQKDSNILLIDILIGVFSFPLAILGVVIFLSNWIKKTKINQENSNIHLKNRAFNPWLVISMFLLVILAYLYGKSENIDFLGTKTKVFPTSVLQTSVTPYQPPNTPIPNKYTNYTAPTTDSDPIVDCNSDKCGTNKVRQSECSKSTCCQINDNWIFFPSQSECIHAQQASLLDCNLTYGTFKLTGPDCLDRMKNDPGRKIITIDHFQTDTNYQVPTIAPWPTNPPSKIYCQLVRVQAADACEKAVSISRTDYVEALTACHEKDFIQTCPSGMTPSTKDMYSLNCVCN